MQLKKLTIIIIIKSLKLISASEDLIGDLNETFNESSKNANIDIKNIV